MPVIYNDEEYLTLAETAVELGRSSQWVSNYSKNPTNNDLTANRGDGKHRLLFHPEQVTALKAKLYPPLPLPNMHQDTERIVEQELYSVEEAAKIMDLSFPRMHQHIAAGHIRAVDLRWPGSRKAFYKISREEINYIKQNGWRDPEEEKEPPEEYFDWRELNDKE